MDPLVVAGGLGEEVDLMLVDSHPLADAEVPLATFHELREGDPAHFRALWDWPPAPAISSIMFPGCTPFGNRSCSSARSSSASQRESRDMSSPGLQPWRTLTDPP